MLSHQLNYSPSAELITRRFHFSPENPLVIEKKFRTPTLERPSIASQLAPTFGPLGLSCREVAQNLLDFSRSINWKAKYIRVRFIIKSRNSIEIQLVEHSPLLIMSNLEESKENNEKHNQHKIIHNGNLTFQQVIEIAKRKKKSKTARNLRAKVKEVLGTCKSVGCTVNGEEPKLVLMQMDNGSNVYQIVEE